MNQRALFQDLIGQETIEKSLKNGVAMGRIPHAQMFVCKKGSGGLLLALAYAEHILESDTNKGLVRSLQHPDLHMIFPVVNSEKAKSKPVSDDYIADFRKFIASQPYGNLFDWYQFLGVANKQGQIGVSETQSLIKKLHLKPYMGGFQIVIIWMAEKMNNEAANKLLKLLEEPPQSTIFLLVVNDENDLLKTITSRCQIIHNRLINNELIVYKLKKDNNLSQEKAIQIAQQVNGDFNQALKLLNNNNEEEIFQEWFVKWVRSAFKARGNASVIEDLIHWSHNIAGNGREVQKNFLFYCMEMFRQALMVNYGVNELVYYQKNNGFDIAKFAPFVHNNNISSIQNALEEAIYQINRNGNAKMILLDTSMALTRFLHAKKD